MEIFCGCALVGRTTLRLTIEPTWTTEQSCKFGHRHLAGALVVQRFDDVAGKKPGFIGWASRHNRNHVAVAEALGDGSADACYGLAKLLVMLVLLRAQVAGVGVERLEQSVQGSVADLRNVRIFDIVGANPRKDFAVNAHLAICAVISAARLDADRARYREAKDEERQ